MRFRLQICQWNIYHLKHIVSDLPRAKINALMTPDLAKFVEYIEHIPFGREPNRLGYYLKLTCH